MALCGALLAGATLRAADGPATVLDIQDAPAGGKQAVATLRIPAPPEAVRAVLNDFEHWPELFDGRFQLVKLDRQDGRVVTDLRIKRSPLPGTLRLVCETRDLPTGEIVTSLVEGDFRRYVRRWKLVPEDNGSAVHTRAEMELSVDPDTWSPGWLFATVLRGDLEAHFRILRDRSVARFAGR
jgi:ribosome-associated toxin RatA of RatAB toxin-antitoxin module